MGKIIFTFLILITYLLNAQISFDSNFESGNLAYVQTSNNTNFYITTQKDEGIDGGSTRWFYFKISNVKDKQINLNFTNTDVTKAMYSYDNKTFVRFNNQETFGNGVFIKTFEKDTVYLAYYTPYNYSYLQERISEWKKNQFVFVDTIGFSPKGFPIQEVIITDSSVPSLEKKSVWIHARTHPSETPSSWHFDGIVQELLKNSELIKYYLTKMEFHLIPFTNPDGVFYGRSRVNYEGINLEPNWNENETATSTEVKILRARMKELNDEKPFSVFLNLHSQASSYCTFWIHTPSSTSNWFYQKEYQFGNLNTSDNPYFSQDDYDESNLRPVYPEGWLWNNYGEQVMALTYETPYDSYFKISSEPFVEVTNENLFEIGKRTVYAIAEYLHISHPHRYILDNSTAIVEGNYSIKNNGLGFYGNDYLELEVKNNTANVKFLSETLPAGNYDVFAWWQKNDLNSYQTNFEIKTNNHSLNIEKTQKTNGGQWNYLSSIELSSDGIIEIKMNNNSTGKVVADAFRLIYAGPITKVDNIITPNEFTLYQNYPNPFNPTTTIQFSIPNYVNESFVNNVNVSLKVYDILGKEVTTLIDEEKSPGTYSVIFNSSSINGGLSSGTYIYRLQVGKNVQSKRMILLK